jgi:uncharacterized protein with HEPN domain
MSSAASMARIRVSDALSAVAMLEKRLINVSAAALEGNDVLIDACAYRIGVIGEAIGHANATIAPLGPMLDRHCKGNSLSKRNHPTLHY